MTCVVFDQARTARTTLVQTPAMHAQVREQVVLLADDALWLAFSGNWSCECGCVLWVCVRVPAAGQFGNVLGSLTSSCTDVCPLGQYSVAGSQYCSPCPIGTYASSTGSGSCSVGCSAAAGWLVWLFWVTGGLQVMLSTS